MKQLPRGVWIVAALLFVALALVAGRYGYHRDELYFIEGGRHLDWSQPDQPIGVPLLAAGWHWLTGGHLWAFRLLPALVSAGTVLVGALSARELGARPGQQTGAAAATALTSIVPGTGHLFSTTTFDLFGTAATLLLLLRAVDSAGWRPWLAVGLAAGLTLEVKLLLTAVLGCCLIGLVAVGPRALLRRPWPYAGGVLALLLGAPAILWQATHDWPMLDIGASIARGGSASSVGRGALIPMSALMAGPLYAVVIGFGIVWLLRLERRATYGWLAVAFLLYLGVTLVTGGKAYYPAGFFPMLLAAGVIALPPIRPKLRLAVMVVFAVPTVWFSLPVSPVGSWPFRVAAGVNPDSAETVGWPAYVDAIARVADTLPPVQRRHTIVLTSNYGEAGAVDLARRDGRRLPATYSGHNAYGNWGPPPAETNTAVVVGEFRGTDLRAWFGGCRIAAHLQSPRSVDNDEDGAPVRICTAPRQAWTRLWPRIKHLG